MQINKTTITFDLKLRRGQVRKFRGAIDEQIANAVGDNDLFHNHDNSGGRVPQKYLHRYPLIQYQEQRQTYRAQMVGLKAGADALVEAFLDHYDGQLYINQEWVAMKIVELKNQKIDLTVSDTFHAYSLQDWLPLREKSYLQWQQLHRLTSKLQLLEQQLANNIIGFAKGMAWQIPQKFEVYITEYTPPKMLRYRGNDFLSFNIRWEGNICLPFGIGLGKGVSEGRGRLNN